MLKSLIKEQEHCRQESTASLNIWALLKALQLNAALCVSRFYSVACLIGEKEAENRENERNMHFQVVSMAQKNEKTSRGKDTEMGEAKSLGQNNRVCFICCK